MSNNFTAQLSPDKGTQQNPGATAHFDDTLWYLGNGHNTDIWAVYRTVASNTLDPTEAPGTEKQHWSQYVLHEQRGFNARAGTARQPALAVAGDFMYFVWIQHDSHDNQPSNSVWATRYTPTGTPGAGTWSPPTRMPSWANLSLS